MPRLHPFNIVEVNDIAKRFNLAPIPAGEPIKRADAAGQTVRTYMEADKPSRRAPNARLTAQCASNLMSDDGSTMVLFLGLDNGQ